MTKDRATLYLNMIIKEDEPIEIVKRSIDSVKDFIDGMYITVTYLNEKPTDSPLIKLLKSYKANISYFKWVYNFAVARQYALDQVPRGENIFFYWQDADDVLANGENLYPIVQDMVKYKQVAVYFDYWYQVELDEKGEVREILVLHKRERILRNDDTFKWVGALHETLIEQKTENLIRITRPECHIIHLTDPNRLDSAIERNIQILEETRKKEQGKDPRTTVYLARAYLDKAKMTEMPDRKKYIDLALKLFHDFLEGAGQPGTEDYITPSGWAEERATAWGHIGELAVMSGNFQVAASAYQSAIDEAPHFPNYYVDLAMAYLSMEDYKKAKSWLLVATSIPSPDTTIITTPRDLRSRALEVSYHLNIHEQKLDEAVEDAEALCKIHPNDEGYKERLKVTEELRRFNQVCQAVVAVGKYLEEKNDKEKLAKLVEAIPDEMKQERFAAEMRNRFLPAKDWKDDEIAIICGPGFENWSPKSIDKGVGGSEEAVIYLSRELAKMGWKITVYGDPGRDAGIYDGVEYKQWYDINPQDNFNVLILWRSVGFLDINPKSKYTLLWMHDMPNNPDFTQERVDKIDKIAVLSEYHKSQLRLFKNGVFYPMPSEKVMVTANGIPTLDIKWNGNPKRMIYSSSYDRGLIYLLNNWEKIIKEVPDAELHIFYGWELFDAVHKNNPERMKFKNMMVELMKQKGIIHHGRVGHKQLAEEFAKSGIWAYPTDFTEISCITAMKAQSIGAIPVVTNYAALEETVKNGIKVDVNITTEDGQKEYVNALIAILKDEKEQEEIRKNMIPWAKDYFKWANIAGEWDTNFRVSLQNPERKYEIRT